MMNAALAEDVQFHGFFSQSFIHSQDNPFYDQTPGNNFNFREFSLSASWEFNSKLRFAGQILARRAGSLDDGDPKIDVLLADYNFYNDNMSSAGLRLGRIKVPYGIYNSTRDVPHARPGVYVPPSVYFETLRDSIISVNGVGFYYSTSNNWGDFSLEAVAGTTSIDNDTLEYWLYVANASGSFDETDEIGIKFNVTPSMTPNLTLALSYLDNSITLENTPTFTPLELFNANAILTVNPLAFPDYITGTQLDPQQLLFSVQYAWRDWTFTAEHLTIKTKISDYSILNQPYPDATTYSQTYYFQAEMFATEKLSLYTRFEQAYINRDDKDGALFALATGNSGSSRYATARVLGARWYFTPDFSMTGEYARNHGNAFLSGPNDIDYSSLVEKWDRLILQMSYHF